MSSGRCTKDSATQSTPSFRPNFRSLRSFSVKADSGSTTLGTFTPLRSDSGPIDDTRLGEVSTAPLDAQAHASVVQQQLRPGLQDREDLGMGQQHAAGTARGLCVEIQAKRLALDE
jgi:hypothetical protein